MSDDLKIRMPEWARHMYNRLVALINAGGGGGGGGEENVINSISLNGTNVPPDANKNVALVESDPTVPSWAKQSSKPTYTAQEVGAVGTSDIIDVSHGGTGASNAAGARANLGVPSGEDGALKIPSITDDDDAMPTSLGPAFAVYRLTGSSSTIGNDGNIISMPWNAGSGYGSQIFVDTDPTYTISLRQRNGSGVWNAWKRIPMGDGTGASGTWGINVTGSAGSVAWGNVSGRPTVENINLTLASNWAGYDGNPRLICYGGVLCVLHIGGSSKTSIARNTTFLTVPSGYRPAKEVGAYCYYATNSKGIYAKLISNGSVQFDENIGATHWIVGTLVWFVNK